MSENKKDSGEESVKEKGQKRKGIEMNILIKLSNNGIDSGAVWSLTQGLPTQDDLVVIIL